jgi:sarcosine oxidase subunit alpha
MSTAGALAQGYEMAQSAAKDLGKRPRAFDLPSAEDTPYEIEPFWDVGGNGRAWLDFQNDVTTKDVKQAAQENFRSVEHMKR